MAPGVAPPVLVTGAPRSGTSLTVQILAACGAWVGNVNTLWENTLIREGVLKPPLEEAGVDVLGLRSFADPSPAPRTLRRAVEGVLGHQGYEGGLWAYKDAKLVFQWRAWAEAFRHATWVAVWRDPEAVADSLERWSFTAKFDLDTEAVVREYHTRLQAIPAIPVHPQKLICGDSSEYEDLVARLGLTWDQRAVQRIVDPSKWGRHKEAA